MKINIHGFSNLGIDLYLEGVAHGHDVRVDSSEKKDVLHTSPGLIINTRGGCAGGDFVDDPPHNLWHQNITTNIDLCRNFPKSRVLAFSSNSAMECWRTPYASIKASMENIPIKNFEFIRVGNLYGKHKKDLTFPGKLLLNTVIALPVNPIVPIPTDWFAKRFFDGHLNQRLLPCGVTSPHYWGQVILGKPLERLPMTEDRNQNTWLDGISGDHWLDLFIQRLYWYR